MNLLQHSLPLTRILTLDRSPASWSDRTWSNIGTAILVVSPIRPKFLLLTGNDIFLIKTVVQSTISNQAVRTPVHNFQRSASDLFSIFARQTGTRHVASCSRRPTRHDEKVQNLASFIDSMLTLLQVFIYTPTHLIVPLKTILRFGFIKVCFF